MVEPLSLLPLTRAHCKLLVVAADPCQLPPVIASPAATTGELRTLSILSVSLESKLYP